MGAFALTVYIGLYDKNLSTYQPLHWDLNWFFAAADIVAAIFLIGFWRKPALVLLGGVIWPILYVIFLAVDVYTKLCLGGNQANCWPSKTDAFQYLIVNNPNIANGYGWKLWTGTMPSMLGLLAIAFILSIISLYFLRKEAWRHLPSTQPVPPRTTTPPPAAPGQNPPPPNEGGQQNPPRT